MSDILSKLAPKPVVLDITTSGETVSVTIVPPSRMEWLDIEASVLNPPVPHTRIDPDTGRKVPNPADVTYQRDLNAAAARRALLIVTRALVKGGNAVPGETLDEQADALNAAADAGVINAIYGYLRSTLNVEAVEAEISARAAGFPATS